MTIYKNNYTYLLEYSNGQYYHGVRSCDCSIEDDAYYGSSKYTPDEIPKKTILTEHSTRDGASKEEIRYHAQHDVMNNDLYYNRTNATVIGLDRTGTTQTPEAKKKISDANSGAKHPHWGKTPSKETRKKLSDAHSGEKSYWWGKKLSKETIKKMSEAKSKTYIATDPQGNEFPITNLKKWARENGLNQGALSQVAKEKQKHHKGYRVRYAN